MRIADCGLRIGQWQGGEVVGRNFFEVGGVLRG